MITALIVILGHIFGIVAFKNFKLATQILICLLPAYLVRIEIGPLPSTALEIAITFYLSVYLIKYFRTDLKNILNFFLSHRIFSISLIAFLSSSVISIFVSDMWWYSFGQWRAYFLEPFLLFLVLIGRKENLSANTLTDGLIWSSLSVSLYAVLQKVFSFGLSNDGRAISFFTSPNSVGLYLAPLIVLILFRIYQKSPQNYFNFKYLLNSYNFWLLLLAILAIVFTGSLGTVLGLAAALVIGLYIIGKKRLSFSVIIVGLIFLLAIAGLAKTPAQKVQSFQNRITLWSYSFEFLTASPKNYVFGTGIRQFFRKIQKPHYDVKKMERLIYPHNIFLNFWTEIGFFGMLGFAGIFAYLVAVSRELIKRKKLVFGALTAGILTVILIHGLVDVPYFKNDLAIQFFFLVALIIKVREEVC